MKFLIVFLICFNLYAVDFPTKPNIILTPGELCTQSNPDFKELRYKEQIAICNRNVPVSRKNKVYDLYGIPQAERVNYTIDHMIPLFIGGTNSEKNLWPQHKSISSAALELKVYQLISSDKLGKDDCLDLIFSIKK